MNLKVGRDSVEPWNSLGATNIRAGPSLALPTEISSWSQHSQKRKEAPHEAQRAAHILPAEGA